MAGSFNDYVFYYWNDLIALAAAIALFNGGLTGKFYTHRMSGRKKLIADVKSPWWRLLFLCMSGGIVAWLIYDVIHKTQ